MGALFSFGPTRCLETFLIPPLIFQQCAAKITELAAKNAVPMVQRAIDAVREEGQYQAIKYLFEMIGLYPVDAPDESAAQGSLAQILLDHLGLSDVTTQKIAAGEKSQPTIP